MWHYELRKRSLLDLVNYMDFTPFISWCPLSEISTVLADLGSSAEIGLSLLSLIVLWFTSINIHSKTLALLLSSPLLFFQINKIPLHNCPFNHSLLSVCLYLVPPSFLSLFIPFKVILTCLQEPCVRGAKQFQIYFIF